MVYLSGGKVLHERSWWSVDAITDLFWSLLNFIVLFVTTLVSPGYSKAGNQRVTDYRGSGRGAEKGRRIGRIGGGSGGSSPPSPPPMGGG